MEDKELFIHTEYGYCYYQLSPPFIYNLYIEPHYRGQGLGRKILRMAIAEIRALGGKGQIEIVADPQDGIDKERLVKFYQAEGLTVIREY